MLLYLLAFLLQDVSALLTCNNQTITLAKATNKNNIPAWLLPTGSYANNQNCLYQINIPKFYSAEVIVDYSGFIEPHLFSVSDTYGGIISSSDGNGTGIFSLEFPYPAVIVAIITGDVDNSTEQPIIGGLMIRSIEHKPFHPAIMLPLSSPGNASFIKIDVNPLIEPGVPFLGNYPKDTSLMFKSTSDSNITLHVLYYSLFEVKMQLINVHIYTYDDSNTNNFYVIGTLFSPEVLSQLNKQAICLFVSKQITQEIFITVTNDQNTNYFKGWGLSYALSPERPTYIGPTVCLDATDGPAASTVFGNWQIFDKFHLPDFLTNHIVTNVTSPSTPFPVVKVYGTLPQDPVLMTPIYSFSGDPNELPQKMFGNKQTFVIETGSVCIELYYHEQKSGWNFARPKRKGFEIAQTPNALGDLMTKGLHFWSEDGVTNYRWNFTLNLPKSRSAGGRCDIKYTYNNQTIATQLLFNYSDPTANTSLVFDAQRVDSVLRPAIGGAVWIDFLVEEISTASQLGYLLGLFVNLLRFHL